MKKSHTPLHDGHIALVINESLLLQNTEILQSFVTAVYPAVFHSQSVTSFVYKTFKIHCYFVNQRTSYFVSDFFPSRHMVTDTDYSEK